ncbi:MAG: hypothetical protein HPY66_3602 [Firmicutes bacterium]|nr:hypothetical protein [Bacillota bacterium]
MKLIGNMTRDALLQTGISKLFVSVVQKLCEMLLPERD